MADEQCDIRVLVPEKLRRAGRGKGGFERHYTERPCKRKPLRDGICGQHSKMLADGWTLVRWSKLYGR